MEDPNDVEVLLAGLEVGSISELRRLVTAGRRSIESESLIIDPERLACQLIDAVLATQVDHEKDAERASDTFLVELVREANDLLSYSDDPTVHPSANASDVSPKGSSLWPWRRRTP